MYITKECPRCHCSIEIDKEICPFCGYDFNSTTREEKSSNANAEHQSTSKNYCPNCGTKLNIASNFCPTCGYNLSSNTDSIHTHKTYSNQHSESSSYQTYGTDKYTASGQFTIPSKSGFIAGLLAFFLGIFGFHNLYLRRYGQGAIQLITTITCYQLLNGKARSIGGLLFGLIGMPVVGIWAMVDFFKICHGSLLPIDRMIRIKPWQETILTILEILLIIGLILIGLILIWLISEI